MEVAAILSLTFEDERGEPVVMLTRGLAMGKRAENEDVVLSFAHAPREREENVRVHIGRSPLIEHERRERFAIRPSGCLARLRIQATCVLEIERRHEAKAVIAASFRVVGEERAVNAPFG